MKMISMCTDSRVMQALENLTESQVNDFLTGRAPLFLAMKLGEHMMFVQLQLSASSCNSRRRHAHIPPPTQGCHQASNTVTPEKSRCNCGHGPSGGTSGAVIDSVNHLGQGVYSGTFSGTLDSSIQDPMGKPKRDINTILQILNDLLMASPQFRQSANTCPNFTKCYPSNKTQTPFRLGEGYPSEAAFEDNHENISLRGKVQTLQRMMEERKLRRQGKRGLRAPYYWPNRQSRASLSNRISSHAKFDSTPNRDCEIGTKADNLPSSADATFPTASTAMEQESVLV